MKNIWLFQDINLNFVYFILIGASQWLLIIFILHEYNILEDCVTSLCVTEP